MFDKARAKLDSRTARSACLVLASLAVYLPVLLGGFVMDDQVLLTSNPFVRTGGLSGLWRIWTSTRQPDYFPLTLSSLWLEEKFWGPNASGYHITNVLLHVLGVFLLWRLFERLGGVRGAWLAALLFAVHPLNASSVAWIAERKNALSLPLYLLSGIFYLRWEEASARRGGVVPTSGHHARSYYGLALGAFALALLAKTSGAMLPIVLVLFVLWRRGRIDRHDLARLAPFFALSLVLGLVTVRFQHRSAFALNWMQAETVWSRIDTGGWSIWFYLRKILLPVDLSLFYPLREPRHGPTATMALSYGALIVLFGAAWWKRRRWGRPVLFGLGTFVVLLSPVLGYVTMSIRRFTPAADHLVHLALPGFLALAAGAASFLYGRAAGRARLALGAAGLAIVVALSAGTWRRARLFGDAEGLLRDVLKNNPTSWAALNGLGHTVHAAGRYKEGEDYFRQSVRLNPGYAEGHNNVGAALSFKGRHAEAVEHFVRALRINPEYRDAHRNLASQYYELGRLAEAERHYRKSLAIWSEDTTTLIGLTRTLKSAGRFTEALEYARKALEFGAGDEGPLLVGEILLDAGDHDGASTAFREILSRQPAHPKALFGLGRLAELVERLPEALFIYQRAAEQQPDWPALNERIEALQKRGITPFEPPSRRPSTN